jgi:predicted ribosomally synthesized peptide with nif11-like leader
MSNSNLQKFAQLAATDEKLREKIQAASSRGPEAAAAELSRLAAEAGVPVPAEEFQRSSETALSDEDLASVAGGDFGQFMHSVFYFNDLKCPRRTE